MDKWQCIDCLESDDFGCVFETDSGFRPDYCPLYGKACNWKKEENDNG